MNLRKYKSIEHRRLALEKALNIKLPNIAAFSQDFLRASVCNCENMIGAVQIPIGIAGPIKIRLDQKKYYLPLATTEGALVASVNRGCKAITESGGVKVQSFRVGASRGPVFKVKNIDENSLLFDFLEANQQQIKKVAESTSNHLKFMSYTTNSVGLYRFVRFMYDTKDAMGLNMVTFATEKVIRYIEQETGIKCVSLSGNFCVDKKASWQNFLSGRGFEVWAEIVIPYQIVKSILKTTPEIFVQTWLSKCMIGTAVSGSMGFNAQYANILSALFIATGQDPAHISECSVGITTAEVIKKDIPKSITDDKAHKQTQDSLYVSVYLPDLMVGSVGGGTGLATQREALDILGVYGGNKGKNSQKLAEIVGAAVLSGEISLLASLSEGSLSKAHELLGRGKKQTKENI